VFVAIQTVQAGTGENGGNTVKRAVKLLRNAASSEVRASCLGRRREGRDKKEI